MILNFSTYSIFEDKNSDIDKIIKLSNINQSRGATKGEEENAISLAKDLIKKNKISRDDLKSKVNDIFLISIFGKEKKTSNTESESKTDMKNFIDITDDKGRKLSLRLIKLFFNKDDIRSVIVYDKDNMYNDFITSAFYTFMNYYSNTPTRTTAKRIENIHVSWFEPNDDYDNSGFFFGKGEETIGSFSIYTNTFIFTDIAFEKPTYPILYLKKVKL